MMVTVTSDKDDEDDNEVMRLMIPMTVTKVTR